MLDRVPIEKVLVLTVPFMAFAYLIYYGFYSLEHARAKNSEESLSSIFTSSSSSMMSLPQATLNSRNGRCSYDLYRKYKSPRHKSEGSWKWCEKKRKVHSVRPGYSFGTLSNVDRSMWERSDCNSLLLSGPQFSCFDKYSWKFLKSWLNQNVSLMYGGSVSDMYKSLYGNYLYSMKHVMLDPTKTEIVSSTNSRVCHEGFLTTFATKLDVNIDSLLDPYVDGTFCLFNGYKNINMNELKGSHSGSDENNNNNNNNNDNNVNNVLKDIYSQCEIIETKPVFLVSHDDIYNLAHFMNDAMSLWSMLMLSGKNGSESILLNIDGLNYLGPSGGTPHRMMNVKDPDTLNMPFVDLYKTWYSEIKNLDSYGNKKICFKELYVIPNPVAPWVWDGWRHQSECSLLLPSSLYQSYNFFIRDKWETNSRAISGKSQTSASYKSLSDTLHLVISIRKSSSEKEIDANVNSLVRVIANINSLVESIHSNIPNLKITLQDFSDIDYVQQVNLIQSANVFLGMHGSALAHIFHFSIGTDQCCALVELFPEARFGYSDIVGFQNIARNIGSHYFRYQCADGSVGKEGTTEVDTFEVTTIVLKAVKAILKNANAKYPEAAKRMDPITCLNDVQIDPNTIHNKLLYDYDGG